MSDYASTTLQSEASELDFGDDMSDLLQKVNTLTTENDDLRKQLREKDHDSEQKLTELQNEVDRLTKTNNNLDRLLKVLKKGNDADTKLENKRIMSELESRVLVLEQSEQNLKRKNKDLSTEISNLKLENEKLTMKLGNESHHVVNTNDYGNDLTSEEAKNIINELLTEIEDLKQEKSDIGEKALEALAEKEMENLKITEDLEVIKDINNTEIRRLIMENETLNTQVEYLNIAKRRIEEELSNTAHEVKNTQLKSKAMEEQYKKLKTEIEEKEHQFEEEKEKMLKDFDTQEHAHKIKYLENEQELMRVRLELGNKKHHHEVLTEELDQNSQTKDQLTIELDNYKELIKSLEEQTQHTESHLKEIIESLKKEIAEYEKTKKQLKADLEVILNEKAELITNYEGQIKEQKKTSEVEIMNKDSEIKNLLKKLELLELEKKGYLNEFIAQKEKTEKQKAANGEIQEQMKKLKEHHSHELKKQEDKAINNEQKLEYEKKCLNDQIKQLSKKKGDGNETKEVKKGFTWMGKQTLSEAMDETEENPMKEAYNNLMNENTNLLNQIADLKSKMTNFNKQNQETDILKKEVQIYKSDIKEIKQMYEEQIEDLQKKMLDANSDLQRQKRRLSNPNLALEQTIKDSLSNLTASAMEKEAEIKFLNEKIMIHEEEVEKMKALKEKDIQFMKNEVLYAEKLAVNAKVELASLAFEKDSEILKYKNFAKRQANRIKSYKQTIYGNGSTTIQLNKSLTQNVTSNKDLYNFK